MGMGKEGAPERTTAPLPLECDVVTVADFDGALISQNSFSLWIKYVAIRSLTSGRFGLLLKIFSLVVERKVLRSTQHVEFKRGIDSLEYPADWALGFVRKLRPYLHSDVLEKLRQVSAGDVLIATAAPSCYARFLPELLPLPVRDVICSQFDGARYIDNVGAVKRDRVCSRLSEFGGARDSFIFFTDHEDDLPTATVAVCTYLCHPTTAAVRAFEPINDRLEILG